MKQMTVSALTDKDLVGARDNEVGEIERVVESTADKKQHLVISRGGFLGLFETEVLVSLENVAVQGDRIVLRNLTEEQVKALPKYTRDDKAYRRHAAEIRRFVLTEATKRRTPPPAGSKS